MISVVLKKKAVVAIGVVVIYFFFYRLHISYDIPLSILTEMAEHHDAKAVLKIARELVHRVQSLIENQWMVLECLRNDHQSLCSHHGHHSHTQAIHHQHQQQLPGATNGMGFEPALCILCFDVVLSKQTTKYLSRHPWLFFFPWCLFVSVLVWNASWKWFHSWKKIVLILCTWYFLVLPYKWKPVLRVAIASQIGHL